MNQATEAFQQQDSHSQAQTFDVFGMWCTSCAKALEKHISLIDGVKNVRVDFATSQITVHTFKAVDRESINRSVSKLGYSLLQPFSSQTNDEFKKVKQNHLIRNSIVTFASMWSTTLSLAYYTGAAKEFIYVSAFIGSIGALYGLIPILKMSLVSLKTRTITFDLLVAVANSLLIILSIVNLQTKQKGVYFESVAMTVTVILWSRYFDLLTRFDLRSHVLDKFIKTDYEVEVLISEQWKKSNLQNIREGRQVRIFRDQQIPFDGVSTSEHIVYLDNSNFNGEFNLSAIKKNENIFAGAILKSDMLTFTVNKTIGHRRIDQIFSESLNLTNDSYKPWIKNIIENWSSYILLMASSLFFIKFIVLQESALKALESSAILLLVTCPCALIIIDPLSKLWVQKESKNLVKYLNPNKLRPLNRKLSYVLDKTGTILHPNEVITTLKNYSDLSSTDIYHIIASTCFQYPHPLTKEIIEKFPIESLDVSGERVLIPGKGVIWKTKTGSEVRVGSKSWLTYAIEFDRDFSLGLSINGVLQATISISPEISDSNLLTLKSLKKSTEGPLILLTGDTTRNTKEIKNIDIFSEVHTEQSPENKQSFVNKLRSDFDVIYIGDGVNDVLAHASADLSVLISKDSNKVYSLNQTAAIAIQANGLKNIPKIVSLIKGFYHRQKLAFASGLLYNLILIPTAIFSYVHPLIAVVSMTASTALISYVCLRKGPFHN